MTQVSESEKQLRDAALLGDGVWPIAGIALALASLDRPGVPLDRYLDQIDEIGGRVADCVSHWHGSSHERVTCLGRVLSGDLGYRGDTANYDDLQNANLMRVMDRRKGLPVALGILYIQAARDQGWDAEGLESPGHFLIRVTASGSRTILDPFHCGRECSVPELRALARRNAGGAGGLEPGMTGPVPDREVLLRLLRNIALRLAGAGDHAQASTVCDRMLMIAPDDERVWVQSAMINVEAGRYMAAVRLLSRCLEEGTASQDVRYRLAQLRDRCRARLH